MITPDEIGKLTALSQALGYDLRYSPSTPDRVMLIKLFCGGEATGDTFFAKDYAEALDAFETWVDRYDAGAKTPNQIDSLKRQWLDDPNWDIEHTGGFEFHFEELKAYRLEMEAKWHTAQEQRLAKKADDLGIPGNLKLAAHILNLENQLKEIRDHLDDLLLDQRDRLNLEIWGRK